MIRLGVDDRSSLLAYLRSDVPPNVFLLGVLHRAGPTGQIPDDGVFYGSPHVAELRAVAYVTPGGLTVVHATDVAEARHLGIELRQVARPRLVVGPREASDAFWEGLAPRFKPRLWRAHQLYVLRPGELLVAGDPAVRTAHPRDIEAVFDGAASMQAEELGVDPRAVDPDRFRRRVARLIAEDAIFVLPAGDRIAFQASASTHCPDGAQIEAVYTPPAIRGRGYATRGLAGMCRRLFDHPYPVLTLHVNEDNEPAVRLYENLGFRRHAPYRLISG